MIFLFKEVGTTEEGFGLGRVSGGEEEEEETHARVFQCGDSQFSHTQVKGRLSGSIFFGWTTNFEAIEKCNGCYPK